MMTVESHGKCRSHNVQPYVEYKLDTAVSVRHAVGKNRDNHCSILILLFDDIISL